MSALAETLRALSDVLDGRNLRWFVFGAQAVAARGAPRATQASTSPWRSSAVGLPELINALEAEGLSHRSPELADELLTGGAVLPLSRLAFEHASRRPGYWRNRLK